MKAARHGDPAPRAECLLADQQNSEQGHHGYSVQRVDVVHHGVVIDGDGQPHQQEPGGDVEDLLPPGVLPDRAARGAVDLQDTHSTDDQGDDEEGPVEVAGAEVAGHGVRGAERARGRAGEPAIGARANERARGRAVGAGPGEGGGGRGGGGAIRTSASSSSELKYAASITGDSGSAGAGVGGRGKPKRGNCPILVAPSPPRPVAPSAARRAFLSKYAFSTSRATGAANWPCPPWS